MEITIKCSGCGGAGKGKRRAYMARGQQRFVQDPPATWGIRFVGNQRLNICRLCAAALANGSLVLNGDKIEAR
jgi:hypothetical protein